MIDSRLFPNVQDRMDWTVKRQQMLVANITNIDTPQYQAKDVAFSEQLQRLQLTTTKPGHISSGPSDPRMVEFQVEGKVKTNGNNVDMDRELTELTKNGLQYLAMVQYVSQKLKTLKSAINEGGKV